MMASARDILLVRHAQAQSNLLQDFSDWKEEDDELTEQGLLQASAVGTVLRGVWSGAFQLLCSPATRARRTAEIIADVVGVDLPSIVLDARLLEKEADENFASVARRAWASLEELCSPGQRAVCVTHGHVIQSLIAASFGLSEPEQDSWPEWLRVQPWNGSIHYFQGRTAVGLNMVLHLLEQEPMTVEVAEPEP